MGWVMRCSCRAAGGDSVRRPSAAERSRAARRGAKPSAGRGPSGGRRRAARRPGGRRPRPSRGRRPGLAGRGTVNRARFGSRPRAARAARDERLPGLVGGEDVAPRGQHEGGRGREPSTRASTVGGTSTAGTRSCRAHLGAEPRSSPALARWRRASSSSRSASDRAARTEADGLVSRPCSSRTR